MSKRPGRGSGDYEVGYKKPPVHTRFQPGNPGRSKGLLRKEKLYTMADAVEAAMLRKRKIRRGDQVIWMTTFQIMVERIGVWATSGTPREAAEALRLIDRYLGHLLKPAPQETAVTYRQAEGSSVPLPPAALWKKSNNERD